jgi:hypothetical protein
MNRIRRAMRAGKPNVALTPIPDAVARTLTDLLSRMEVAGLPSNRHAKCSHPAVSQNSIKIFVIKFDKVI